MKKGAIITDVAPLPLTPIVAEKPWGSVGRSSLNVPSNAEGLGWGEIWLASEDFGLITKIASGPHAGQTLAQLKAKWGGVLTGQNDPQDLKNKNTLPASVRLERTGDLLGPVRVLSSDEFWYVFEAGPESWLGVATTSKEGPWIKRFKKIPLEAGDRFLIPQGLTHCQGPSAAVLKTLPSGSLVETLHDWDRAPDPWDFPPPPTPIPVIHTELPYLYTVCSGRDRILYQGSQYSVTLVNTNFFTADGEKMSIICPVRGRGSIETSEIKEILRLHPGQATLIPAGIGRYSIKTSTIISYLVFEFI